MWVGGYRFPFWEWACYSADRVFYSGIRVGGQFHLPLEEILLKKIALCEILARVHHTVSDAANVGSRLRQVK